MTFMSRKISNDLENMGATARNTFATKQSVTSVRPFFCLLQSLQNMGATARNTFATKQSVSSYSIFQRLVLYKIQD